MDFDNVHQINLCIYTYISEKHVTKTDLIHDVSGIDVSSGEDTLTTQKQSRD